MVSGDDRSAVHFSGSDTQFFSLNVSSFANAAFKRKCREQFSIFCSSLVQASFGVNSARAW